MEVIFLVAVVAGSGVSVLAYFSRWGGKVWQRFSAWYRRLNRSVIIIPRSELRNFLSAADFVDSIKIPSSRVLIEVTRQAEDHATAKTTTKSLVLPLPNSTTTVWSLATSDRWSFDIHIIGQHEGSTIVGIEFCVPTPRIPDFHSLLQSQLREYNLPGLFPTSSTKFTKNKDND